MTLTELLAVYRELLYLPDPTPILGALATVAANRLAGGDPVWTVLVGPPSSGKSEIIDSLRRLPESASISTLTKASLLSGHASGGGGLLQTRFASGAGLLLIKDFTSILSETPATRNELLAILREVFDGHVECAVGTRATVLAWGGRLGLITGVTEEIEQHRQTIAVMGDRFVYVPMTATDHDRHEIARRAIDNGGHQQELRRRLRDSVAQLFATPSNRPTSTSISDADQDWLITAADLASLARSPVLRDTRSREIELVPEPELPARLVGEFSQLWRGLAVIGAEHDQRRALIRSALMAGVPKTRRLVLLTLLADDGWSRTVQVTARTRMPHPTCHRVLEDLAALGVIESDAGSAPSWSAHAWAPSERVRRLWTALSDRQSSFLASPDESQAMAAPDA